MGPHNEPCAEQVCVCVPDHTSVECNLWERMTIEQATGARCAAITVTVPEGGVTTLYSKVVTHTSAQASSKSSCRCAFQHEPMGYSHVNLNSKDTYFFLASKAWCFLHFSTHLSSMCGCHLFFGCNSAADTVTRAICLPVKARGCLHKVEHVPQMTLLTQHSVHTGYN